MISWEVNGIQLEMETQNGLFSPENIDRGTLAMLSVTELKADDKLLDLGCGYGTVGIYAAMQGVNKITMTDVNDKAVECSRKNIELNCEKLNDNSRPEFNIMVSDGLDAVTDRDYTIILSNPPYHADFNIPKRFIEDGFRHLAIGGRMVMVTKRRTWYENKLRSVFGGVRVAEVDGYFVFTAEKREKTRVSDDKMPDKTEKNKLSKKLARKYGSRTSNHSDKKGEKHHNM